MKRIVIVISVVSYLLVWNALGRKAEWSDFYLSPPTPAPLLQIASGYARQMAGFSLFVKVAIFSGGLLQGVDKNKYADSLAENFDVMTELYPEFIDSYHYCQSFLAPIAPEYAQKTNMILDRGVKAHPGIFYLPFFRAFNYFYYLQMPTEAAEILYSLSKMDDAPSWFGHFAGTLMGRGGNLRAGLTMLKAMHATEQDESMKERYRLSIGNFERALAVQATLDRYRAEHGKDAGTLQDLVPVYMPSLPALEGGYELVWEPPLLRLDHPETKTAVRERS